MSSEGVMKKNTGKKDHVLTTIEKPLAGTGSFPAALQELRLRSVAIAKDPQIQAIALSISGGAVALGATGGACGMAVGGAAGAAVGILPAVFTFGLSIPVCAVVGGTVGTIGGMVVGSGAGIATGGLTYKYRIEIKNGLVYVQTNACGTVAFAKMKAQTKGKEVKVKLLSCTASSKQKAIETMTYTQSGAIELLKKGKAKSLELQKTSYEIATNRTLQVTVASATAGGVALGTTGGVAGLATGGAIGAAVGLIPALFTFGLSIPIGACIGATSGAIAGSTAGGTMGAVGGGVAGNRIYVKRDAIKTGAVSVRDKANGCADYIKGKAQEFPTYVKMCVTSGTGGTETHLHQD